MESKLDELHPLIFQGQFPIQSNRKQILASLAESLLYMSRQQNCLSNGSYLERDSVAVTGYRALV